MEAKKYVNSLESDAYVSSTSELELSSDPMNSILDPNAVILKQSKKEVLPKKKYFTVALHLEWIMYRGKAQVYEICIQGQDMTNLELFVVPYDLKKETELMERLGFTFNKIIVIIIGKLKCPGVNTIHNICLIFNVCR